MSNYEATRYDFDGGSIQGLVGITTGSVIPWSDSSIPTGFLDCNGAAVSRSTYADLFATIGTTYGSGDGSTTFNLPNLQDDIVMGRSPTKALASTGGANTVTHTGNASGNTGNRTIGNPTRAPHSHPDGGGRGSANQTGISSGPSTGAAGNSNTGNRGGNGGHNHPLSVSFSGSASSVLQPYLTVIYIIKT